MTLISGWSSLTKLADWEIELLAPFFGGPLTEYLAQVIPYQARRAYLDYPRIPADDFGQAIWTHALEKREKLKRLEGEGKRWSINRELRRAAVRLLQEDDRQVRAAKAAQGGYNIEDEEFYSTGLLAKVLPALIAADMDVADAMQRASTGTDAAGIHIRSSDPHGGAENYQAMLIDIAAAWKRLTEGQRRLLRAYYGADQEDTADGRWERQQLASSMGLTESGLRSRSFRALEALQAELGGDSPWR
jgi:hypothetical protein